MSTTSTNHYSSIIIGAGQAGLATSYWLSKQNIDHLILEKSDCIAPNWRSQRWDSFCLVTPNWQCQLPGMPYSGNDPDGFMVKDDVIAYLENYYRYTRAPVFFNSPVNRLEKNGGRYFIETPTRQFIADHVVIACGSYHLPNILPAATAMPDHIEHIHSSNYKNSEQLPAGEIMVVGTGQSGCQIAEDLHLKDRKVHLCVGTAPRVNRRYRGKDVVNWLDAMNYYETTIDKHPEGDNAPNATNHYVTGRDGGRDINLRIFAEQGMQLYGRLKRCDAAVLQFHNDLATNLNYADAVAKRIRDSIERHIQENSIEAPADDNIDSDFLPYHCEQLDLNQSKITAVVWATGFSSDYSWLKLPVFKDNGQPIQSRGISPEPGLYFVGLNWMNTWGSGRFYHVGRDAEHICNAIAASLQQYKTG
ncbi:MSMEG_0569 family flavin-dependent oxidoreductase [Zhongshania sp.]|jgi:putative flavoprotein involved in K+ transport|uniref:MSMEG_0569 family flavin-dependent oxidoreductase n=1 Tax=Zhongshania sp. TaxID=1971902 RepID=UPI0039E43D1A